MLKSRPEDAPVKLVKLIVEYVDTVQTMESEETVDLKKYDSL